MKGTENKKKKKRKTLKRYDGEPSQRRRNFAQQFEYIQLIGQVSEHNGRKHVIGPIVLYNWAPRS